MKQIILPQLKVQETKESITRFIVEKALELQKTGAVIGLSGGVDSTLSASLTRQAFNEYNAQAGSNNLELKGLILPSSVNNIADAKDGIETAEKLGIQYKVIDIEPHVNVFVEQMPELLERQYDRGNLMSRIRANILHTQSALENKLVMGTGNQDEDLGIGYYTLFGDGAVHVSPIGDLSKRHVKELVRTYGFDNIANREPTAGLEPGQTDFTDLGYSYETVELLLEGLKQGIQGMDLYKHPQVIEQVQNELGRSKFDTVNQVTNDFLQRHEIAIKKAELLSPPIAQAVKIYK